MRRILMVIILVLLFTGNAAANPNDFGLHQINATHWYFVTAQTDLIYGTYNYQAFANNISSDYMKLEYGVQPVQDLITEDLDQTWIKFNWSDYTSADRIDVYELEKSIPYVNETITTDGIKDSCYDECAHAFVFDTPNPISNLNYETVYWVRNDDFLHGYADGYDADSKTQDDNFKIGIDILGDGLTTDDRTYELNEGGTVTAARWSGTAWLPQATTASGAVVGAGGGGSIQYEMEIPLSELTGFVNGVTTKFFMERECTNLIPTVESFYPEGVDTGDSSTWGTAQITATDVYNLIGNTTISEYNSTGLTPYTWYKHKFVNVNGVIDSSAVYSTDITIDVPHYTVSGYILDSITGDGIAGANVWAQNGYVDEITQSDANGFYEGYNFHAGNYSIHANVTGYAETYIEINVTGNLTNQNVTMTAFEMTDWMLWEKLLELEDAIDGIGGVDFTPTEGNYEMLSSTYNMFLLLLGACFILAFPKRGEVTSRDTGLNNVLFSFFGTILAVFLAQIIVSGQVIESFAFESQIYDPLQHYFLYLIAVIMFVLFVLNVLYYVKQRVE